VAVARRDAGDAQAPAPPGRLRTLLGFARLPDRALGTVRDVLDRDGAFRGRVAGSVDADELDEGSRLFLLRPEGWEEALAALGEAAGRAAARVDDERREADARRRVPVLEAQVERLGAELDQLRASAARALEQLAAAEAARDAARADAGSAEAGRARAVRELKSAESLATARLQRVRELEAELAATAPPPIPDPVAGAVPADGEQHEGLHEPPGGAPAPEVAAVVAALRDLADDIEAGLPAAAASGPGADPGGAGTAAPVPTPGRSGQAAPLRRRPVRMARGRPDDSVEGLADLLAVPAVLLLVDGYNASMKGWPGQPVGIQRESLVTLLGALRSRFGAEVHVVFDGAHEGRRPAVAAPLPVRVHFTAEGVEADDRILELLDGLAESTPVVVVSSDHRVRDGARARGANVVSSERLLSLARS
jgi:predicted RNA-binding protein with PIN domain